MARTTARVEDLKAGTLPPICAKTGGAADGFTSIAFYSTPGWTWILLLFGILPFLIARAFSTTRVVGFVPMSEVSLRRGRAFTWTYLGSFLVGALLLALGFVTVPRVAELGVGVLAAAVVFTCVGWLFVWPTGHLHGEWVDLSFVDSRFARALDRWYGAR